MNSIALGPLALPLEPFLLGAAFLPAVMAGNSISRTKQFSDLAWLAALIGLAVARAVHVLMWWDAYRSAPLKMLDIRDGGFAASAGLAAVLLFALGLAWRRRHLAKGAMGAFAVGTAAWMVVNAAAAVFLTPAVALPNVTLQTLEGEKVSLSSFSGRPVVVNLWASWCPPCRREMPMLNAAQQRNRNVAFVFTNQGEHAPAVSAFLFEQSLTLKNVLLDPAGAIQKATSSHALPTTLFFDRSGKLVDSRMGELSEATLEQRLERIRK
jgi:thiol-disulfide isomerase/thioredoxin